MITIATWNVNSVKARLDNVLDWIGSAAPDVLLLQELKCMDEAFPFAALEGAGYACHVHGQKAYNGVALLSKLPVSDVMRGLPGDETDAQARYIEATIAGQIRVASLYLPNGNPVDTEKYPYKLAWMDRLYDRAQTLLGCGLPVVLGGDYNICPGDEDVYDPAGWANDALCRPESRARFRALLHLGYTEAFRAVNKEPNRYSFWDYQAGAWPKDNGLRIDHFLLSPTAADALERCEIDRGPRGKEKASDHTPVMCHLHVSQT